MVDAGAHSDGGFRLEGLANGWVVGRFAALEEIGVAHLVTTRQGPDGQQIRHEPAAAGREIARVLGLDDVAFLEQVHGGEVLVCERGGCAGFADGLVTATRGLMLMGKSGDCPVVLIADRRGRAVGFAHASWRATVAGITPAVVRRMAGLGCDSGDLVACICPSAGPECYEVGDEVRVAAIQKIGPHAEMFFRPAGWQRQAHRAFGAEPPVRRVAPPNLFDGAPPTGLAQSRPHGQTSLPVPPTTGPFQAGQMRQAQLADGARPDPAPHSAKYLFDLWHANTDALTRAGLNAKSIHTAGVCTLCRNDLFPSHRREGAACGRFAAVIGWPARL